MRIDFEKLKSRDWYALRVDLSWNRWHDGMAIDSCYDSETPMSSRDFILSKLRKHLPQSVPLPSLQENWIQYPNPELQFSEVLAGVGGQAHIVEDRSQLSSIIQELPCFAECKRIVCPIPDLSLGNYDLNSASDPHELESVDLAILPGQFGVAENAAVWVDDRNIKHRVIYFLTQHLVLLVPRSEILHNMHQAYERLAFPEQGYGLFISGPSKTADIEQSLVIGAHGPRSMTVLLV
jgi:L-lactate dehydrogenase complex protein LldG